MTAGAAKPSKPNTGKTKTGARCPICRAPTVKAHRPFCSKRCADVDLGRWLKGAYAVPGEPDPGEPDPGEPVSGGPFSDEPFSGDPDILAGFSGLEPDDDRG